jgi:NitT/TauT family transport system ATP-binding protein
MNRINEEYILEINNITHTYNGRTKTTVQAIENVNLHIKKHEFVAIIGPSGCGKSTLLNIMLGILKPSQGQIFIDGKPLEGVSPRIGYISQTDSLLPWKTVIDNVAMGLEIKGVPKKERHRIAQEFIIKTGLEGFENCYVHELSGGMRKRVSIIRALAVDPEIIFMDEPFAPLDAFTKEILQQEILKMWQETKKTIVYITHDLQEAITLSDRVILMSARPSTIKKAYKIDLPRPRKVMDVKFNEHFINLEKEIWNSLKDEILVSGGGELSESRGE